MSLSKKTNTNALNCGEQHFKYGDKIKNSFGRKGTVIDRRSATSWADAWWEYKIKWEDGESNWKEQDQLDFYKKNVKSKE